jgi:hypothetical protein
VGLLIGRSGDSVIHGPAAGSAASRQSRFARFSGTSARTAGHALSSTSVTPRAACRSTCWRSTPPETCTAPRGRDVRRSSGSRPLARSPPSRSRSHAGASDSSRAVPTARSGSARRRAGGRLVGPLLPRQQRDSQAGVARWPHLDRADAAQPISSPPRSGKRDVDGEPRQRRPHPGLWRLRPGGRATVSCRLTLRGGLAPGQDGSVRAGLGRNAFSAAYPVRVTRSGDVIVYRSALPRDALIRAVAGTADGSLAVSYVTGRQSTGNQTGHLAIITADIPGKRICRRPCARSDRATRGPRRGAVDTGGQCSASRP